MAVFLLVPEALGNVHRHVLADVVEPLLSFRGSVSDRTTFGESTTSVILESLGETVLLQLPPTRVIAV